jgi:hypothetical protein
MTNDAINPNNIYISINGYAIDKTEFFDAGVEVELGGDSGEVKIGKGGGATIVYKNDGIHSIKFTLRGNSPMARKLIDWKLNHVDLTSVIMKDMNPGRQLTLHSNLAHVKNVDPIDFMDEAGRAFTIECASPFEIS